VTSNHVAGNFEIEQNNTATHTVSINGNTVSAKTTIQGNT
jgi:hypothetical protein